MKIIGAGLPRTGTLTQKEALEMLGLGPCYHWVNLIADLDEVELWHRALDGEDLLGEIFAGYNSTVDWPGGFVYRQLALFVLAGHPALATPGAGLGPAPL